MYHCELDMLLDPKALDPSYKSILPAFTEEEKAEGRKKILKIKEKIQAKRAAEAAEYKKKRVESIKVTTTNKLKKKRVNLKKCVPVW